MKSIELEATEREGVRSKSALNNLRKEGRVPAVLYGGKENRNFHVDLIGLEKLLGTSEVHMINLKFGNESVRCITRDVQYDPVTDVPLHVDFMEVFDDKPVTIAVPVRFTGNSIGVMNGGQRREKMRKLVLKALPSDIPEEFVVDVTKMKIGDVIQVEELDKEGVEFLDHPKAVIVSVKTSRMVVAATDEDEEDEDEEGEEGEESAEGEGAEKEETAATE
ncbi:MAG: 50S ribosomal protein L25 [Vicingaceae bacterium]